MFTFTVTTDSGREVEVQAEYHVAADDFLVFKTKDHKQVAAFNVRRVESVIRTAPATTEVGTVTVKVVPELDEARFAALLEEAAARAGARLR